MDYPPGKVRVAKPATEQTTDLYVNRLVSACGIGHTQNSVSWSLKRFQCTYLNVVPIASCQGIQTNTFCTRSFQDNNVCGGDYGVR